MAPEIFLKELELKYNEKVDIWALGILIFYLIGGEHAVSYKNVDGNMVRTHNALKMAMQKVYDKRKEFNKCYDIEQNLDSTNNLNRFNLD